MRPATSANGGRQGTRRLHQSGDTVRRLARLHTPLPLLAFTPLPEVRSQLALTWGTETFIVPHIETTDGMIRQVDKSLLDLGRTSAATSWSSSPALHRAR